MAHGTSTSTTEPVITTQYHLVPVITSYAQMYTHSSWQLMAATLSATLRPAQLEKFSTFPNSQDFWNFRVVWVLT